MKLGTVNRLSKPRQRTKDTVSCVGIVAETTSTMMGVTAVFTRSISPHSRNSLPVDQGRFKMPDGRYPGSRQESVQLDAGRHCIRVFRHFNFTTFLVPVRASENNVGKVLRFLFASHAKAAKRPHMERAISSDFMPDSAEGGVKSTPKTVFSAVGTLLQMSVALCTEASLQSSKV
eukprot:5950414-Amphidinium_carterae.1